MWVGEGDRGVSRRAAGRKQWGAIAGGARAGVGAGAGGSTSASTGAGVAHAPRLVAKHNVRERRRTAAKHTAPTLDAAVGSSRFAADSDTSLHT